MSDQHSKAPELPRVRRARGRYVYAAHGRRYLDCYLNDGTAILGHRPWRVSTVVKDVLSTGRYAEYPSEYADRLEKELRRCIPSHPVVRLFQNRDAALAAVSRLLGPPAGLGEDSRLLTDPPDRRCRPVDPARAPLEDKPDAYSRAQGEGSSAGTDREWKRVSYWRPFLDEDWDLPDVLLPVLPFPGMWAGQPVCAKESVALPPTAPPSPVCLAGQLRALQTLSTIMRLQAELDSPRADARQRAGHARGAAHRGGARSTRVAPGGDGSLVPDPAPLLRSFRSRGPYLTPVCGPDSYSELFYTFLENGIILHPSSSGTSIWSAEAGSKDAATFIAVDSACATRLGI